MHLRKNHSLRLAVSRQKRTEVAVRNLVSSALCSVAICEHADALRNGHDELEGWHLLHLSCEVKRCFKGLCDLLSTCHVC